MSTLRIALAAWLLAAAGTASAGVPVIELTPAAGVPGAALQAGRAPSLMLVGQRAPALPAQALPPAGRALPVVMPDTAAAMLVAERPAPPVAALLLLLAVCVMYLARHRGPGFALRPTRTLK